MSENTEKGIPIFDKKAAKQAKIDNFLKDLQDGKISTRISPQKQAQHILGRKEFANHCKELSKRNDVPSYIREDLSLADLSKIIEGKLGTGRLNVKGDGSIQEFFDCDEIIGYYYSKKHGGYVPTNRVQIIYSIQGRNIHVVPVARIDEVKKC